MPIIKKKLYHNYKDIQELKPSTLPNNENHMRQRQSTLTFELVLVLICTLVLSNQDFSGYIQTDDGRTRNQEEHDKLLAHHPQRFVLATVNGGWRGQTRCRNSDHCATKTCTD